MMRRPSASFARIAVPALFLALLASGRLLFPAALFGAESNPGIQPGDKVYVVAPREYGVQGEFQVDEGGFIALPGVGMVRVAAESRAEARRLLQSALGRVFSTVAGIDLLPVERGFFVSASGYLSAPGVYRLRAGEGLESLMEKSGGLKPGAAMDKMRIIREGREIAFDYRRYLEAGDRALLPDLEGGDTLFVPPAEALGPLAQDGRTAADGELWVMKATDKTVRVLGDVGKPGRYNFSEDLGLLDLLAQAGGVGAGADIERIRIYSPDGRGERTFNLRSFLETGGVGGGPAISLGDTVYVPGRGGDWLQRNSHETVKVIGEVGKPGRYDFDGKMSFLDLLAEAGGPTGAADTERIFIHKQGDNFSLATSFDLEAFNESGDYASLPLIEAGDTIVIAPREAGFIKETMPFLTSVAAIMAAVSLIIAL